MAFSVSGGCGVAKANHAHPSGSAQPATRVKTLATNSTSANFHLGPNSDILVGWAKPFAGGFIRNTGSPRNPELFYFLDRVRFRLFFSCFRLSWFRDSLGFHVAQHLRVDS